MERKYNFYSALANCNDSHGIAVSENTFESAAMIAFRQIGNTDYTIKKEKFDVIDYKVQMPCNVFQIESVTKMSPDVKNDFTQRNAFVTDLDTELYINQMKDEVDPLVSLGGFVKYKVQGDSLLFDFTDRKVEIIYKTENLDEEGFPLLTFKEVIAISTYVAYEHFYKKAIATKDQFLYSVAQQKKMEWFVACDDARVPELINQNQMDELLDVQHSYNRKRYGRSFKPFM